MAIQLGSQWILMCGGRAVLRIKVIKDWIVQSSAVHMSSFGARLKFTWEPNICSSTLDWSDQFCHCPYQQLWAGICFGRVAAPATSVNTRSVYLGPACVSQALDSYPSLVEPSQHLSQVLNRLNRLQDWGIKCPEFGPQFCSLLSVLFLDKVTFSSRLYTFRWQ